MYSAVYVYICKYSYFYIHVFNVPDPKDGLSAAELVGLPLAGLTSYQAAVLAQES